MRKTIVILAVMAAGALAWRAAFPVIRQLRLEHQLMANLERAFTADGDPLAGLKTAVRLTFPNGDVRKITAYALFQLAPADADGGHCHPARDEWARKVVTFAIRQEQGR